MLFLRIALLFVGPLGFGLRHVIAQQSTTCSALKSCTSGCCSQWGSCGFGPDFCGDGCQGTCGATAECGKYAPEGKFKCPLNVCCSEFGFCGTTPEFCTKCQNEGGCLPIVRPQCQQSTDAMESEVRIAYYGAWGAGRSCNAIEPENIPAGVLTHINVAFEYVSEQHEITDQSGPIVARVSRLKRSYPGLRVNIAIGGWVFNDPPTQYRFSNMSASYGNQQKFIKSLIRYMEKYGLDGVDLDWEYPVADDRGGTPSDFGNFVLLCAAIRQAFDSHDPGWQITITLPSSYWYLRGFDISRLKQHVDWFNIMTYDIHGLWDQKIVWTGPYLKGHTNITEIEDGLDLLWRNGITPDQVVMGYGFYGRGFTMEDNGCTTPPNCRFSGPAFAGDCTNEPGILSYSEIQSKKEELGSQSFYDEPSTVRWLVYASNQWISYEDAQSFRDKLKYQSSRCLKGSMIWSLDLDTTDFQAMTDFFGEEAMRDALGDTSLKPKDKERLVRDLAAYTGQDCYVTTDCTQGGLDQNPQASCRAGYTSVELSHSPWQIPGWAGLNSCQKGEFHHVCCPTKHAPKNCEWVGAPKQSEFGCNRGCGDSQFELTTDSYQNFRGTAACIMGRRSLCCDSTDILNLCHWGKDCDFNPDGYTCGDETGVAMRADKDNGDWCPKTPIFIVQRQMRRSYCCPKKDVLQNCRWSNDPGRSQSKDAFSMEYQICTQKRCPQDQLAVTKALVPTTLSDFNKGCAAFTLAPGTHPEFPLCCDPPSIYNKDWPVEPKYLWSDRADDDTADVTWDWANSFGNNNYDIHPDNLDENPGADPYGFVMLDGPPGSINNAFHADFTVLQRSEPVGILPRALATTNRTILDNVFTHSEETIRVYCNHPPDSEECRRLFYKGAVDTIIRLPNHVGEGPWARIVSMEPDHMPSLPAWAHRKREATGNQNGVYVLTFDYNFGLIKRDDAPVNMRVDYTNLQGYWDDMTDEAAKRKRSIDPVLHQSFETWKARVDKAKATADQCSGEKPLERRSGSIAFREDGQATERRCLNRRWFGPFGTWLDKLNNLQKSDAGVLPMSFAKIFTLYSGRLTCTSDSGVSFTAGLDITADIGLEMQTRYSYYFSGTVVPPKVIDTYAFVGTQPRVLAGIGVSGDASLFYQSPRKKIIDTLTYPGLAIKGIAAVGPSLDVWGQIDGAVTVAGAMRVGVSYTLKPVEMYLPNTDETKDRASRELEEHKVNQQGLQPDFRANVRADVDFNVRITPEVNLGIKVGGGIGAFKTALVDAHVSAFVNTTVNLHAYAAAGTTNGVSEWSYGYGVKFLYRVGLAAVAQVLFYGQWQTKAYFPFPEQVIPLYGPIEVKSSPQLRTRESLPASMSLNPLPGSLFYAPSDSEPNATMSLIGRQAETSGPKGASEFQFGDFTCTTSSGSPCSPDTLPLKRRSELNGREAEAGRLMRRVPTDCPRTLPRLYYNCLGIFSDYTLTVHPTQGGTGVAVSIPGICSSVQGFLNNWMNIDGSRGGARHWLLNWDSGSRADTRRQRSCPGGYCGTDNALKFSTVLGAGYTGPRPALLTSCDEFPFASTEDGGETYLGLYPHDPFGTTRTCVPQWQQTMQGLCNGLMNNLETNVEYFNNRAAPNEDDPVWASWKSNVRGWTQKGEWGGRQRLSLYPKAEPPAAGMTAAEREIKKLSFYHKRNFTLHLAYPEEGGQQVVLPGVGSLTAQLFDPSDRNKPRPVNYVTNAQERIICGVNTMGQDRFRINPSAMNGYCWDGVSRRPAWRGLITTISYFYCMIDFRPAAAGGNTKRDSGPISYLGDQPVYGIKRLGENKELIVDGNSDMG